MVLWGRVLAPEAVSFAASTLSDPWTVLPPFSGQKVTERGLKQETVSWGPGSAFSVGVSSCHRPGLTFVPSVLP